MTDDQLRRLLQSASGSDPGAPDSGSLLDRGRRRLFWKRVLMSVTVVAVTASFVIPISNLKDDNPKVSDLRLAGQLQAFDSCGSLLAELKQRVRPAVGPAGYTNSPIYPAYAGGTSTTSGTTGGTTGTVLTGTTGDAGLGSGLTGAPTLPVQTDPLYHSSTTDRTRFIDEPDLIKSDGVHVFTLQGNTLRIYDAAHPALVGTLTMTGAAAVDPQMLLDKDRVVILGGMPVLQQVTAKHPTTVLRVVDVSDATKPTLSRVLTVDGTIVDARLQSGTTRLVTSISPPQLPWFLSSSGNADQVAAATMANQGLLDATTIDDWLPTYGLTDGSGKVLSKGRLMPCERVTEPSVDGDVGTDIVGTVSFDPTSDDGPQGAVAVLGAGHTVYAHGDHLWLATGNNGGWGGCTVCGPFDTRIFGAQGQVVSTGAATQLYGFDVSDPKHPVYLAGTSLTGVLHDDYSVDETDAGQLRVVTTDLDGTRLTVLDRDGAKLHTTGSLLGLAPGEQVQSVRWVDQFAYVVTYQQIDPLHVVDLSDPAHPRLRGTLQLPGFSSYLFSPEKGRLVGVGVSSGAFLKAAVKLFDISDPDLPTLLSTDDLGGIRTDESNHAILFWKAADLLFVPVTDTRYSGDGSTPRGPYVAVTRVDHGKLVHGFKLTHAARTGSGDPTIERTAVVGPRIWTLSNRGVLVSTLAAGVDISWIPYS